MINPVLTDIVLLMCAQTTFQVSRPKVGDILDGRFRIDEIVDRDARFVTCKGTETSTGSKVFIKILRYSSDVSSANGLLREIDILRSTTQLGSKHSPEFRGAGFTDKGLEWVAMEEIEGEPLEKWRFLLGG